MNNVKNTNIFVFVFMIFQLFVSFVFAVFLYLFPFSAASSTSIVFSQLLCFAAPSAIILIIRRKDSKGILPVKNLGLINVLLIMGMMIFIQPLIMLLSAVTSFAFGNQISEAVADINLGGNLLISLLIVAVLPAVCEEVVFRGIVFFGYRKVKLLTAALVNGLFFGLMHFSLQQFLYAFILGVLFCYLVRYTGTILASILAHFTLNGTQTLYSFFVTNYYTGETVQDIRDLFSLDQYTIWQIGSVILVYAVIIMASSSIFAVLFYLFIKKNGPGRKADTDLPYHTPDFVASGGGREQYPVNSPHYEEAVAYLPAAKEKVVNWAFVSILCLHGLFLCYIYLTPYISAVLYKIFRQ